MGGEPISEPFDCSVKVRGEWKSKVGKENGSPSKGLQSHQTVD
jgi:hypothetical protein